MCKKLGIELVIGLDMQQLHHIGCDWTDNGWMFLQQGADMHSSIDAVQNITNLKNY